jgi:hypothetical protein
MRSIGAARPAIALSLASRKASRWTIVSEVKKRPMRAAMARATRAGVSSSTEDGARDARRRQLVDRGQDPRAGLVELADDARADRRVPVVELLLELVLDQGALLLDDEDLL